MFTGIIEAVGTVKSIEKKGAFGKISVDARLNLSNVRLGDSIAIDGACLTVTSVSGSVFSADVSAETLTVTTLGALKPGSRVNVEPALTLSKPLGGHIVTGHIDGVGSIKSMAEKGGMLDLDVSVPAGLMGQVVRKGSIAVDGISLTVAEVFEDGARIAVIPHTIKNTTLEFKKAGSPVNIETDIIGKYVERFLGASREKKGISEGFLSEHGFLRKGF